MRRPWTWSVNKSVFYLLTLIVGAHACGWAGKYARNFLPHWQLGRIDALDPAGPWFDDKPKDGRLHLDDARFVQVIHTNGGLYSDGEDTIGMSLFSNQNLT